MASSATPSNLPLPSPPPGHPAAAHPTETFNPSKYVFDQIDATRIQVKVIEAATETVFFLLAVGLYLAACVVLDHWVLAGGLGGWGRTLAFAGLLVGAAAWIGLRVAPLVLYKINPLYAAWLLERSEMNSQSSLVNFWFLTRREGAAPQGVLQAIEQRVASDLMQTSVDAAVDRRRLAGFFAAVLAGAALFGCYKFLSPKDPFISVGRVVFPWANWRAPTRVEILALKPGAAKVYAGDTLNVQAKIRGLLTDEVPQLIFSTKDGAAKSLPVDMRPGPVSGDAAEFSAFLPPDGQGFSQDGEYQLVAGDVRSEFFTIQVQPAPAINVARVQLVPPPYTQQRPYAIEGGDFEALEGTKVTVVAEANQPIKPNGATLDFHCDDRAPLLKMNVKDKTATASYILSAKEEDQHDLYYLVFTTLDGRRNPKPTRHRVRILQDLAPEVEMVAPARDLEVPADKPVLVHVKAHDPDFGLSAVRLFVQKRDRHVLDESSGRMLAKPTDQPFDGQLAFVPEKLGLKAGDEVTYWVEASDVKEPQPNVSKTDSWKIKILPPTPPDQLAQNQPRPQGNPPPAGERDPKQNGQKGERGQGDPQKQPKGNNGAQAGGEQGGEQQPKDPGQAEQNPKEPAGEKNQGGGGERSKEPTAGEAGNAGAEPKQGEGGGESKPGMEAKEGENPAGGKSPEEVADRRKPESAGDVFEEVLNELKKQGKAPEPPAGEEPKQPESPQKQPGGKNESAEKTPHDAPQGTNPPKSQGESPEGGEKNPSGGGEKKASKPNGSDPAASEKPQGKEPGGGKQPGGASGSEKPEDQGRDKPGLQEGRQRGPQEPKKGEEQSKPGENKAPEGAGEQKNDPGAGGKPQSKKNEAGKEGGSDGAQEPKAGDQKQGGGERAPAPSGSGDKQGDQAKGNPAAPKGEGEKGSGDKGSTDKGAGEKPDPQASPKGREGKEKGEAGAKEGSDSAGQKSPAVSGGQPSPEKPASKPDGQSGGASQQSGDSGPAQPENMKDRSKDDEGKGNQALQAANEKDKPPAKGEANPQNGGDGEKSKGNAGDGKESGEKKGAPNANLQQKVRDKQPGDGEKSPSKSKQEANSSMDERNKNSESNAKSDQGGDRSGGGEQGGGQKANQKGTGAGGNNSPSDEGSSEAPGAGKGNTSNQAGDKAASGGPTGKSSETQKGNGTKQQQTPGGSKAGAPDKPQAGGDPSSAEADPSAEQGPAKGQPKPQQGQGTGGEPDPSGDRAPSTQSGGDAVAQGGNKAPDRVGPMRDGSNSDVEDKADLDYAKRATDLVLRHLRDELGKENPDPKLLQKLGWSKDDLRKFVAQWENLRNEADQVGPLGAEARKKLEERLRGLGLTRDPAALRTRAGAGDDVDRLQEAGRFAPPAEYADQVDAFRSGVDGKLGPKKVK